VTDSGSTACTPKHSLSARLFNDAQIATTQRDDQSRKREPPRTRTRPAAVDKVAKGVRAPNIPRNILPPPSSLCFHRRLFSLFVCLLAGLRKKITNQIVTKFGGKVAHSQERTKRLDFGGNPDHITLGLGL